MRLWRCLSLSLSLPLTVCCVAASLSLMLGPRASSARFLPGPSQTLTPPPPTPPYQPLPPPNPNRIIRRAKYRLRHLVRVNMAGSDTGFSCVYQTEDEKGDVGVRLSKDLTTVAAEAMRINLSRLGPLVLPLTEKLAFASNMLRRKLYGRDKVKTYVPSFKSSAEHVLVHAGGRAVIDGMQRALKLTDEEAEPSRATLYKWGNVSSSSVWYELAYVESFRGVRKGDRVWQLSFGSGFKCNSAVWVANRGVRFVHPCWAGFDHAKMRLDLGQLEAQVAEERAARKQAEAEGKFVPSSSIPGL